MTIYEWINKQTMKCSKCDEDHPLSEEIKDLMKARIEMTKIMYPEITDDDLIETLTKMWPLINIKGKKSIES